MRTIGLALLAALVALASCASTSAPTEEATPAAKPEIRYYLIADT